jgi:hypothetical protein
MGEIFTHIPGRTPTAPTPGPRLDLGGEGFGKPFGALSDSSVEFTDPPCQTEAGCPVLAEVQGYDQDMIAFACSALNLATGLSACDAKKYVETSVEVPGGQL